VEQSSDDFVVPSPGFTAANVAFTRRITMNDSTLTAPVTLANKIGLVVFDGAGQPVGLAALQIKQLGTSSPL